MQTPNHWPEAQIFGESLKLDRNTVNGCFPGRNGNHAFGERAARTSVKRVTGGRWFPPGHSTNGESAALFGLPFALLSILRKPLR
jgi:hypothetical protein